ncbi:MAG: type II toxin-antitoxin system RelE/ParE family toxin, partial [Alphaproteobacteria bacterium]|nr:type II toxin-antitoxin system RelE/ParE family toxin [Alphaproteobacteria bacterium]
RWTTARFGHAQARAYAAILRAAMEALAEGPRVIGAKPREDVGKGLFTLHVARCGNRGRHILVFRPSATEIEILRLLHDAMDPIHHLAGSMNVEE